MSVDAIQTQSTAPAPVLILAGGRAERMGGIDKAFYRYQGRSLIARALALATQLGPPLVASSRSIGRYRELGVTRLDDALPDYAGPLSALLAGFESVCRGVMLSIPVDLVGPTPADLRRLLQTALESGQSCFARADTRRQPLLAAWQVDEPLIDRTRGNLQQGRGAVYALQDEIGAVPVDFSAQASAWKNLNQPELDHRA